VGWRRRMRCWGEAEEELNEDEEKKENEKE